MHLYYFSVSENQFCFVLGLTLAEDGTVQSIEDVAAKMSAYENGNNSTMTQQDYFMPNQQQQQQQHQQQQQQHQQHSVKKEAISSIVQQDVKPSEYADANEFVSPQI